MLIKLKFDCFETYLNEIVNIMFVELPALNYINHNALIVFHKSKFPVFVLLGLNPFKGKAVISLSLFASDVCYLLF